MAVILGYFYFGQDERLRDEGAVIRATDNATRWLLDRGYGNVLVEINNECNVRYDHPILKPDRVHELMGRVRNAARDGRRLLVSTSYGGGAIPTENVVRVADFLLLHGNGVPDPAGIAEMVRRSANRRDTPTGKSALRPFSRTPCACMGRVILLASFHDPHGIEDAKSVIAAPKLPAGCVSDPGLPYLPVQRTGGEWKSVGAQYHRHD
jgi:hypothetical protein